MLEQILTSLEHAGAVIKLFAVVVMIAGFAQAAGYYALRFRKLGAEQSFHRFKIELGRALTLGLEILVLVEVLETIIMKPTLQSLGALAFLVVVRTLISWTLALQVKGHWPWQASAENHENV